MSVAANESALINGLLECHSKGNSYTEALNNLDGILTARARTHRECSASADSNTTSKSVVSGNGKTGFASTVTRATAEMSREESMVIQRRYLVMANELEARIKEGDKGSFSDTPAPSSPVVPVKVQSDIRSPEIKGTDQTPKLVKVHLGLGQILNGEFIYFRLGKVLMELFGFATIGTVYFSMPVTRTSTERDKRQAERELRPLWKARKHVFSGSTTSSVDVPLGREGGVRTTQDACRLASGAAVAPPQHHSNVRLLTVRWFHPPRHLHLISWGKCPQPGT
ncbi:hypothetical protein B0H14DRAFT_3869008 [Mycena olivaceomarginata]|nr:hypothetical protein B0H14DRAFT_3869008 [Mycena olivaceomarginata]